MKDGMFVFDNVIHMYDQEPRNIVDTPYARAVNARWRAFVGRPVTAREIEPNRGWASETMEVERAGKLLFEQSQTDMVVAQTVPYRAYWKNAFAPAKLNYELAAAYPDRVIFCGGVDPLWEEGGVEAACREMERQVVEWGAQTFKFYNSQYDRHWRCDDRQIAYPMYEKAQALGIGHIQFHKGDPIGMENLETLSPLDLQAPARDFPDLKFVIHHLGDPYWEETCNIGNRFPNVYLSCAGGLMAYYPIAPERTYHMLGRALQLVGPDRMMYGSEAFAWLDVQAIIDQFAELQIPEELQDRYGYPEITPAMRRRMFGETQAELFGLDIAERVTRLYGVNAKVGSDQALVA